MLGNFLLSRRPDVLPNLHSHLIILPCSLSFPLTHSHHLLGNFLLSGRADVLPRGRCCRRHQQHHHPSPTPSLTSSSAPRPRHLVTPWWYRGGSGGRGGYRQCQWHRIIVVFHCPVSYPPTSSDLASWTACCHPSDRIRARGRAGHRNHHLLLSTSHLQSTNPSPSLNHLNRGRVGGGGGGGRTCGGDAQPRGSDRHRETGVVVLGEIQGAPRGRPSHLLTY